MGDLPKPGQRAFITVAVMLASIMQALDTTIANVALPHIQGSLSATQEQMSWVLTSYIVSVAIMMPLSGWLAGQFGRKKIFMFSIAGFTLSSVLCGVAQSLPQMVVFRVLQGLSGAALIPMSQAILLDSNPPERHGKAMAMWAMGITIGPILGPVLGGWLTDDYSWRWVFYINVPFGIMSFLGIGSFVPETEKRRTPFDFFGFITLSLGIGAMQIMLDRGQVQDWFSSTEIWIETIIAGISFYLLAVHTATARAPFISPALFKDRNFSTGTAFIFFVGIILFATLALLPPMLQDLLGYPVSTAGWLTAPRGLGTWVAMFLVGRLGGKMDVRIIITTGFVLTAISLWQMTGFYLQMDSQPVVVAGLVQGLGMGLAYLPLATVSFTTLAPHLRNEGTAVFNLLRNVGSSIGISVVQFLFVRNSQTMHARLAEQVTVYGSKMNGSSPLDIATINNSVNQQAAMIAYNNDFQLMLILTVAVIPLIFLLSSGKRSGGAAVVSAE
jgi:MFS transporter, DHA2 family, multidrug resistance protein